MKKLCSFFLLIQLISFSFVQAMDNNEPKKCMVCREEQPIEHRVGLRCCKRDDLCLLCFERLKANNTRVCPMCRRPWHTHNSSVETIERDSFTATCVISFGYATMISFATAAITAKNLYEVPEGYRLYVIGGAGLFSSFCLLGTGYHRQLYNLFRNAWGRLDHNVETFTHIIHAGNIYED